MGTYGGTKAVNVADLEACLLSPSDIRELSPRQSTATLHQPCPVIRSSASRGKSSQALLPDICKTVTEHLHRTVKNHDTRPLHSNPCATQCVVRNRSPPRSPTCVPPDKANSTRIGTTLLTLTPIESLRRAERLPIFLLRLKIVLPLYGIPSAQRLLRPRQEPATSGAPRYSSNPSIAEKTHGVRRLLVAGDHPRKKLTLHQPPCIHGREKPTTETESRRDDSTWLTGGLIQRRSGQHKGECRKGSPSSHRHRPRRLSPEAPLQSADGPATAPLTLSVAVEERCAGRRPSRRSSIPSACSSRSRDGPRDSPAPSTTFPEARTTQLPHRICREEFTCDCEPEVHSAFAAWKRTSCRHGRPSAPNRHHLLGRQSVIFHQHTGQRSSPAPSRATMQHFEPPYEPPHLGT